MFWSWRIKKAVEAVPDNAVTIRVNSLGDEIAFSLHACRIDGRIFWAGAGTPAWHMHRDQPFGREKFPVRMRISLVGPPLWQIHPNSPIARLTCPECAFHIEIPEDGVSKEELYELFHEWNSSVSVSLLN